MDIEIIYVDHMAVDPWVVLAVLLFALGVDS